MSGRSGHYVIDTNDGDSVRKFIARLGGRPDSDCLYKVWWEEGGELHMLWRPQVIESEGDSWEREGEG